MSGTNKVLKSGIWYTVSSIAIRAVAIITSPIYTAMLTTDDYGRANGTDVLRHRLLEFLPRSMIDKKG